MGLAIGYTGALPAPHEDPNMFYIPNPSANEDATEDDAAVSDTREITVS